MMDKTQKGISIVLEIVFPTSLERYCCRHIYMNFKEKYHVCCEDLILEACKSSMSLEFKNHISKLYIISPVAYYWLMQIPL